MSRAIVILLLLASGVYAFDHSHAQFQAVLDRYVIDGKVNYEGLSKDRAGLDSFVTACGEVSFEQYRAFTKNEKLAMMLNLYNAAAIQYILNHWPVGSIQEIGGLFSSPWNDKFVRLFGHEASLGMIEHDILRADFKEPRVHFAVVRTSQSGGKLPGEAYRDDRMNQMLSNAEQRFLKESPAENRFENGVLHISPMFKWYRADFDGEEGVKTLLQIYYPEVNKDTRIEYTEYDWSLNSQ